MRIASAPRGRIVVAVLPILLAVGCTTRTPVLTGLLDAHDAAGNLQVHFAKAVDASNRAVMADTDEVSVRRRRKRSTRRKPHNAMSRD